MDFDAFASSSSSSFDEFDLVLPSLVPLQINESTSPIHVGNARDRAYITRAKDRYTKRKSVLVKRIAKIDKSLKKRVHVSVFGNLISEKQGLGAHLFQLEENFREFMSATSQDPSCALVEFARLQQDLPIYKHRSEIMKTLMHHTGVVLEAPTGVGKSTAVPMYLFEKLRANDIFGSVFVILPRMIAARSISKRVCKFARRTKLDYEPSTFSTFKSIEEECIHPGLKFTSELCFLELLRSNPLLNGISAVCIDEAHERTIYTDVILGMLLELKKLRVDPLYTVVMSATMNTEGISTFLGCPSVRIDVCMFPIETRNLGPPALNTQDDIGRAAAVKVKDVLEELLWEKGVVQLWEAGSRNINSRRQAEQMLYSVLGTVLVFLPRKRDCEIALVEMQKHAGQYKVLYPLKTDDFGRLRDLTEDEQHALETTLKSKMYFVQPVLLHEGLRPEEQDSAISLPPHDRVVRVVFATSIAETALTIPNVRVVIDYGLENVRRFDHRHQCQTLAIEPISLSSQVQRRGRAGRTRAGVYFECYNFTEPLKEHEPQICKSSLELFFLKALSLGCNPFNFLLPTPPHKDSIDGAELLLRSVGAITESNQLTDIGKVLAYAPVAPCLSALGYRLFQNGYNFGPAVIASLSVGTDLYFMGSTKAQRISSTEAREKMSARIAGLCEPLVITATFIDALKNNLDPRYMTEQLSLNVTFAKLAKETFILTSHVFDSLQKAQDDLNQCIPLFKELLLRYYPNQLAIFHGVENVHSSLKGSGLNLIYKDFTTGYPVYVDWLIPPRYPPKCIHYQRMEIVNSEGRDQWRISNITDMSDTADTSRCSWACTSFRRSWDLLHRVSRNLDFFKSEEVYIYRPKRVRDAVLSAQSSLTTELMVELSSCSFEVVFIHRQELNLSRQFACSLTQFLPFLAPCGSIAVLAAGLQVSRVIPVKEDLAPIAVDREIAPSLNGCGELLQFPNSDVVLRASGSTLDELVELGFTLLDADLSPKDYLLMRSMAPIDIATVSFPSQDDASFIQSVLDQGFVQNMTQCYDEPSGTITLQGDSRYSSVVLEKALQEHGFIRYTNIECASRNDESSPNMKRGVHLMEKSLHKIEPGLVIHNISTMGSWVVAVVKATPKEVELISQGTRSILHRVYQITRDVCGISMEKLKCRLSRYPASSWFLDGAKNALLLRAFTYEAVQALDECIADLFTYTRIGVELERMLIQLSKASMDQVLSSLPCESKVSVDYMAKRVFVRCPSIEHFISCCDYIREQCCLLYLSSTEVIGVETDTALALHSVLVDNSDSARMTGWGRRLDCPDLVPLPESNQLSVFSDVDSDEDNLDLVDSLDTLVKEYNNLGIPYTLTTSVVAKTACISTNSPSLTHSIIDKLIYIDSNATLSYSINPVCFDFCDEPKNVDEYCLAECGHMVCLGCLNIYLGSLVNSTGVGFVPICCPRRNCETPVTLTDLETLLTPEQFRTIACRSVHSYIEHNQSLFSCPTPNCSRALVRISISRPKLPRTDENTSISCQGCKIRICALCCEQAHPKVPCSL